MASCSAQVLGFGLYLSRCVLNGSGDSIIDLAKMKLLE